MAPFDTCPNDISWSSLNLSVYQHRMSIPGGAFRSTLKLYKALSVKHNYASRQNNQQGCESKLSALPLNFGISGLQVGSSMEKDVPHLRRMKRLSFVRQHADSARKGTAVALHSASIPRRSGVDLRTCITMMCRYRVTLSRHKGSSIVTSFFLCVIHQFHNFPLSRPFQIDCEMSFSFLPAGILGRLFLPFCRHYSDAGDEHTGYRIRFW